MLKSISFTVENVVVPTANHQRKKIVTVKGFSRLADKPELVKAKDFWTAHIKPFKPPRPLTGPLSLTIRIAWPYRKSEPLKNRQGMLFHTSTPDLSNMVKTIEDRLVEEGFIKDDAAVALETTMKEWAELGSFTITIRELDSPHRKDAQASPKTTRRATNG